MTENRESVQNFDVDEAVAEDIVSEICDGVSDNRVLAPKRPRMDVEDEITAFYNSMRRHFGLRKVEVADKSISTQDVDKKIVENHVTWKLMNGFYLCTVCIDTDDLHFG